MRVVWCDNGNAIRAKAIHVDRLEEYAQSGVSLSVAQQAIPIMYDAVVPETGLAPTSEVWLVPDWSTLKILPYTHSHAQVIGDIHKVGQPWALCPRSFLKRMLDEASELRLQVMAAFENEFYLLKSTASAPQPADNTGFCSTRSMNFNAAVINEIAQALIAQNIPVELYYPESGPGQQEISVRYTDALSCADRQVIFRETVHGVAACHGLKASFLPKVYADKAGSGCHLHWSLWQDGQNLLPDPDAPHQLCAIARSFLAGILHHLPGLMAMTAPSCNSYRRFRPHVWSGAFCCWGIDNREAALRVPSAPKKTGPTHVELRAIDATANPYLALGAVIAAGLAGVNNQLEPPEAIAVDPGYLSESEREARKITPYPTDLGEAIEHLQRDRLLLDALGPLAKAYLAVRRAEWEALKDLSLEEEVELLLERY